MIPMLKKKKKRPGSIYAKVLILITSGKSKSRSRDNFTLYIYFFKKQYRSLFLTHMTV